MTCTLRSSANVLNDSAPWSFQRATESNKHFASSAKWCCSDTSSHDNNADFCCSRSRRTDNNRRSCGCLANEKIRNNGYRICRKLAFHDKGTSMLKGIMAWMSSIRCGSDSATAQHRRRRSVGRGSRPGGSRPGGSRPGGAALLLALCVTGMAVSRGGMGVAAARLPIIDEVYQPNGGDPGNVEVDPANLASPAEQQQALLEYLEDPPYQPQMYSQQQLMQFALRLREHPELLAQIMALAPAARRYSLIEEVIARMPAAAAAAVESTPAPPQPKRGNYMALCHFKICNMGRKRTQEMP